MNKRLSESIAALQRVRNAVNAAIADMVHDPPLEVDISEILRLLKEAESKYDCYLDGESENQSNNLVAYRELPPKPSEDTD